MPTNTYLAKDARYLGLDELAALCLQRSAETITDDNCVWLLCASAEMHLDDLHEACSSYMLNNLLRVARRCEDTMRQLDQDLFVKLLADDKVKLALQSLMADFFRHHVASTNSSLLEKRRISLKQS